MIEAFNYAALASGSFLGSSIQIGIYLTAAGELVPVVVTGAQIIAAGAATLAGLGIMFAEHTKNKSPSSKNKQQKGQTQRQREKRGGEKGYARRPYQKCKRNIFSVLISWILFNDDN